MGKLGFCVQEIWCQALYQGYVGMFKAPSTKPDSRIARPISPCVIPREFLPMAHVGTSSTGTYNSSGSRGSSSNSSTLHAFI